VVKHRPGDYAETFAATPTLAYPDEFRFLIDPELVEANVQHNPGRNEVNAFGRQLIELAGEASSDAQSPEQAANLDTVAAAVPVAGEELPHGEEKPGLPLAFKLLPDSALELRGKAAYMQRSGRYQVLFHESWVQPVPDERAALPIILDRSGDSQAWPELQGHIKLYLSRYLHLETNLWLNTDGAYLGNDNWSMPAPPWAPLSLILEQAPGEELLAGELAAAEVPAAETVPGVLAQDATATAPTAADGSFQDDSSGEEGDLVEEPRSPWRHAVLLRQKRRMRSTEIHYIDHPLLGVVARLMPVSEEELDAMQTPVEEATASAGSTLSAAQ